MTHRSPLASLILLTAACGGSEGRVPATCGLAAVAAASTLLEQFTVPNRTLALTAIIARADRGQWSPTAPSPRWSGAPIRCWSSAWRGIFRPAPSRVRRPGGGCIRAGAGRDALRGQSDPRRTAARRGIARRLIGSSDRRAGGSGHVHRSQLPFSVPRLGPPVSAPRIALGGVVRQWDGAERTGLNSPYLRSVLAAGGVPSC